jgi:hypothetical protein
LLIFVLPFGKAQKYSLLSVMRKRIYYLLLVLPLYLGCSNGKEENPLSDSLQNVLNITTEDSLLLFDNAANVDWLQKAVPEVINNKPLALKEFWMADSFPLVAFKPTKKFYADYSSVLRWSVDSSYIIDGGSYGGVVIRGADGKTRIEAGEPDTEVALIYPKTSQKTRLLFSGPGTELISYRWVDSTTAAIVMAFDEKGNREIDTSLWLIDVKAKYFRKYQY